MTEDKIEYCARMLANVLGTTPCDVGFAEKCVGDEWCEKHCDNREDSKCWEHAIREGWIKDDDN